MAHVCVCVCVQGHGGEVGLRARGIAMESGPFYSVCVLSDSQVFKHAHAPAGKRGAALIKEDLQP